MNEVANNNKVGYPGSNVQLTRRHGGGTKKMKKWALPFYTGKMGA
jgi:hypothetical protein